MHNNDSQPIDHQMLLVAYGLILVGIFGRFIPHPPNVTPLVAVALFSGAILPRRLALLVPLCAMVVSDWILGMDRQLIFNWCALALAAYVGWQLRARRSTSRIGLAALGSSTLFFLISNLGVWLVGLLYPRTIPGLVDCYIAGLPFYRNMLLGDLGFTLGLFGLFALAQQRLVHPQPVR